MARIEFTGNVGRAPELKFTNGGDAYLSFSVADSKSRKLDSGEWETLKEQWFNVTVWRELAQLYAEKLEKGSRVTIWGEFFERKYESDKGPGVSLDVQAKGIEVHPKRNGGSGGHQQQSGGFGQQQQGGFGGQQSGGGWNTPASNPSGGWGAPQTNEPPF